MKKLIFCIFFLFSQNIFAQILNIEKARLHQDTARRWHSNLGLVLDIRQRQNQVINFRTNINAAYITQKNKHHYILIGDLSWVQNQGNSLISHGYLHTRLHLHSQQKISWESFGQIQYDGVRGLRQRWLLGQGVRLHATLNEKTTSAFGAAFMFEKEHWNFAEKDSTTHLPKASLYWHFQSRLSNILEINSIVYYQAMFQYFFDPRLSADINLLIRMSSKLTLNSRLALTYDEIPVVPIDKLIYQFENGIRINF